MRVLYAAIWVASACGAGVFALVARSPTLRFMLALLVCLAVCNVFRHLFLIRHD